MLLTIRNVKNNLKIHSLKISPFLRYRMNKREVWQKISWLCSTVLLGHPSNGFETLLRRWPW